ncbi:GtrA family protein [Pseudoblastomonas halimionae]|uniref:GtrA/DPMS transmembrane domain-containing protein n=1 Tax=Alteriqipengyuania halimionae TaxID=1926630 RepID=A0A6I4U2K7_9SPHN|nr:GtrA family protein [Alteriqipengyuania halimionae]MXP10250.1 hypothetical protein [Alteriqipengyuania halimionae]
MHAPDTAAPLHRRLFTRRVGGMLVRNTVVSTGVFVIGFGVMVLLVEYAGMDKVIASGFGQVVSSTIHYLFGRLWIFRGSERGVAHGYLLFLVTAAIGIVLTMVLMWAFLQFTPIDYKIARILVSVISGLVMFVLNGVFNFKRV